MCKYCEYKPEKLKHNPSIILNLTEGRDFPCSMKIDIHINKKGKFYLNGSYHGYSESDRYYNSWDDELCEGSFSPDFKDKATGFKFCPMCGRKLVK